MSNYSPDRFPIHFVSDGGHMFFADWEWEKFFVSKELLILEEIPAEKFVTEFEKGYWFKIDKEFFQNISEYRYFILLRLLLGSDHTNIFSLNQSVELIHMALFNPEDYTKNNVVKELDEQVGNWKKYDLVSYNKIKQSCY